MKGETYWRSNGAQQLPTITEIILISPGHNCLTPSFALWFRLLRWLKHHYWCVPPLTFTFVYHTPPDPVTFAWGGPSGGWAAGMFCVSTAGSKGTRRLWITPSAGYPMFPWHELLFVYLSTKVRLPSRDPTRGSLPKITQSFSLAV